MEGGGGLVLIGHVSHSMKDAKETLSTLRFAEAAGRMRPNVCAKACLVLPPHLSAKSMVLHSPQMPADLG